MPVIEQLELCNCETPRHMMPYCARNPPAHVEYSERPLRRIMLLLMFCTMLAGSESAAMESEPRPIPANDSKVIRPQDCLLKRTMRGSIEGPMRMDERQSMRGRFHQRRNHGSGRRFTFLGDGRRVLVSGMMMAGACTNKDISIFQSPDGSSGIPRYAVQIMNNCMSDCAPSNIHVFCGWFASALLVNPNSFKRIAFDDCVVNGGKPLKHGETLRFTYANSFMYPLRFKSASFCK